MGQGKSPWGHPLAEAAAEPPTTALRLDLVEKLLTDCRRWRMELSERLTFRRSQFFAWKRSIDLDPR
jgi:hypothetical protein